MNVKHRLEKLEESEAGPTRLFFLDLKESEDKHALMAKMKRDAGVGDDVICLFITWSNGEDPDGERKAA